MLYKMKELISIIVPAFNVDKYIEQCLNSVINQTYKNLEIIVINDGSTDNTQQIIDSFSEKDSRIKIIHKENTGVSDTRNIGLEIAKGDYIGFVDSDDEIKPEMYETLLSNIKNNDADIAHCGFELITKTNTKVFNGTNEICIQSQKKALTSLLKGDIFEPSSCTKLYKKQVLENIKFDSKVKFNEDLLFNVEAFKQSHKIVFNDIPLYKYNYNVNSASRNTHIYTIQQSVLKVTRILNEKISGLNIDKIKNQFYVNKLISIYIALYEANQNQTILGQNVRELLKNSTNKWLDFRTLYLKYSLLYFSKIYLLSRLVYEKFLGKNKKWNMDN